MNLNLTGKLALVSASTAGIGHAIAAQLLEDGARVIINGRDAAVVTQAVDTLRKETTCGALPPSNCNLTI